MNRMSAVRVLPDRFGCATRTARRSHWRQAIPGSTWQPRFQRYGRSAARVSGNTGIIHRQERNNLFSRGGFKKTRFFYRFNGVKRIGFPEHQSNGTDDPESITNFKLHNCTPGVISTPKTPQFLLCDLNFIKRLSIIVHNPLRWSRNCRTREGDFEFHPSWSGFLLM
jgi:hypothetical protein